VDLNFSVFVEPFVRVPFFLIAPIISEVNPYCRMRGEPPNFEQKQSSASKADNAHLTEIPSSSMACACFACFSFSKTW